MLKPTLGGRYKSQKPQPPSGGCVLKLKMPIHILKFMMPAAFRRLCVETEHHVWHARLCRPAAFRRLCVETLITTVLKLRPNASRLQAAVC